VLDLLWLLLSGAHLQINTFAAPRIICRIQNKLGAGETEIESMQFRVMGLEEAFDAFTRAICGKKLPLEYE